MLFPALRSSHNTFAFPLRTPFGRDRRVCALRCVSALSLYPVLTLLPVPPRCFAAVSDLNTVSNHSLGTVLSESCSLLRRACGHVVWAKPEELSHLSPLDQDHALREMAALATLLDAPICAAPDPDRGLFRQLERLCRQYGIPLAALVEEDQALEGAKEVVRLPRQLSAEQRREVWAALVPQAGPDTAPKGAMTIGAVLETAVLALRTAAADERQTVTVADTRQAVLQRGGALEFGVRYQTDVTLSDMVLPDSLREQYNREILSWQDKIQAILQRES